MKYLNKQIKDLLNDNLTLLSYELNDVENLSLQLINAEMRLCLCINTKTQKADVVFLTGEDLDVEEFTKEGVIINN